MASKDIFEEKFLIKRVIPIYFAEAGEIPFSPQVHSGLSPNELSHLQTLLFPDTGKSLLEWNDLFRQIEETFA